MATETETVAGFREHFGQIPDHRMDRTKFYPLEEVLFVLLCGALCGAESWRDFVAFGQAKLPFLREFFPFTAGIPSKNTFARVCASLDPETFRTCFIAWVTSLHPIANEVIAIDGKTLCNSADKANAKAASIFFATC